ncbi:mechanosensitive ion channel family protein [Lentisalinibacter salinarum]|uniref:mechanosensitive ion channel family protein n=1 Tax=Lentisalinibacter salinarum TaxID=2992239 RepID=UPI003865D5E1
MSRFLAGFLALWALLAAAAAVAQSPSVAQPPEDGVTADTEDIEEFVRTLEDPQAREELIDQLKVLIEAQKQQSEGPLPEPASIVDVAGSIFADVRDRVLAIEPRRALISGTVSAAILIGAFLLRWLLLVLMRKLYARLTGPGPGRRPDGEAATSSATGEEADTERAGDEQRREAVGGERIELPGTLTRLLTLIIGVAAVILIAETWGAGIGGLLATDIGSRLAETSVAIGLILIVTAVLWNAADLVIQRLLRVATRSLDRERSARRLDTLVPLLRSVLQATIGVLAALLLLSELGVNIGPLLAGAGILGLAIGFGAQTLVKDLITGVTILLEDGATVGDVVEVAGHAGVVEEMRIRVIQLRDLAGNVHLVPYSDVTTIKNFTKEFSYYLFEIGVAYREDTDEVCDVLRELSDEMQQDEKYGPDIMEPLEILGVDQFADSAVIIKARMKTKPIRQWAIGREFNRRMKKRFDERNIEIPFPHTTLYFGEPKQGTPPPLHVARDEPAGEPAGD